MKRIKSKLKTWDEGRAFMNRIADELGAKVEEIDADLIISHESMEISCHMDDREFSYILIKLQDEKREGTVNHILNQFEKK